MQVTESLSNMCIITSTSSQNWEMLFLFRKITCECPGNDTTIPETTLLGSHKYSVRSLASWRISNRSSLLPRERMKSSSLEFLVGRKISVRYCSVSRWRLLGVRSRRTNAETPGDPHVYVCRSVPRSLNCINVTPPTDAY